MADKTQEHGLVVAILFSRQSCFWEIGLMRPQPFPSTTVITPLSTAHDFLEAVRMNGITTKLGSAQRGWNRGGGEKTFGKIFGCSPRATSLKSLSALNGRSGSVGATLITGSACQGEQYKPAYQGEQHNAAGQGEQHNR